ncbi:hypothetical protein M9Y10_041641 [Tritrichomonas musculus]|uniref:Tetraspanin family protein n=1 Tax=Tritrichomonas musculus TaxID=1915356 RepID=A0ABR2K4Z1_9EUKA
MNSELIANIVDMIGMGSFIFLFLVLVAVPIVNTIFFVAAHSNFFKLLIGNNLEKSLISIMIIGYVVVLSGIIVICLSCLTSFFENKIAYIIAIIIAILCLGVIGSVGSIFFYASSKNCDQAEMHLIFALFANYTYGPLENWKIENRCLEPQDCLIPAHKYIKNKCRNVFTANLALECAAVSLIIIGSICVVVTQCLLPTFEDDQTAEQL